MICKTCICHTEMKPEKVYGKDYIWCMRWKVSFKWKQACKYGRSVCGDCTKCDEETGER